MPRPQREFTTDNHILRSIEPTQLERLIPSLEPVDLPHGMTLYEAGDKIDYIYFPSNAVVSVVSGTEDGKSAEAGLVGREGMSGIEAMLNGPAALNLQIIQL